MHTKIRFGFYDCGAVFKFWDFPKDAGAPEEDAEATYVIGLSYDELWHLLKVVYNRLQESPGRRTFWSKVREVGCAFFNLSARK